MAVGRRVSGAFIALLGLLVAGVGTIGPVAACIHLAVGAWGWLFLVVPGGIVVAVIALRGGARLIDRGISDLFDRAH